MLSRILLLAAFGLAAGCIESRGVACGDGRVCPAGTTCSVDRCLTDEQLAACAGKLDGDECRVAGTSGVCVASACTQVICGNRKIDPGEMCDDGNLDSLDGCRGDCRSDERCGNGVIDPLLGESCDCGDDPAAVPVNCMGPNTDASNTSCRTDCELPRCGNGVLDPGEACDDGNLAGADGCSADCRSDESCGNGIVDYALPIAEECDCGSGTPAAGCSSSNSDTAGLCRSDCRLHCGDGVVRGNELCDPAAPMIEDCLDFGFDAGRVACSVACAPDFAGCRRLGWWRQASPLTSILVDVGGTSRDDYFVLRYDGSIAHMSGGTWQVTPFNWSMYNMWVASTGRVFAVGQDGKIAMHDSGTWTTMASGVTSNLNAVTGTSASNVVAVGANGTIVRFNGSTWMPMSSPTTTALRAVWAAAADDMLAAGDGGTLLRYAGGVWSSSASPTTDDLIAVWGTAPDDVYLASRNAMFHHDGERWVTLPIRDTLFTDIGGARADDVFAVGDMIHHFDGVSWTEMPKPTTARMLGVWSAGGRTFAVGALGTILVFDGEGWVESGIASNGQINAAKARRADHVFAAGCSGIYHFDGYRWQGTVPGQCALDVWEAPVGDVFAVGAQGAIYRLRAGGWVSMASGTTLDLQAVWGTSATDVYTVAPGGLVLHYAGATWDPVTVPSSGVLRDVWGSGPTDVFVVGQNVLHFNGLAWTTEPVQMTANAVWGSGSNDVFVVGAEGRIGHFNGTGWSTMQSGTTVELTGVWGTGPTDVFAVGSSGTLIHYDGTSWTRVRVPQPDDLSGVTGTPRDLFMTSRSGVGDVFRMVRARPGCATGPELACDNGLDDDCDGELDCVDPDCGGSAWCNAGGLCAATPITCGFSSSATQIGQLQRISVYGCDVPLQTGAERMYSFAPSQTGSATATITSLSNPTTDLVVLGSTHGACEPNACIGASATLGSSDTVTFPVDTGATYFIVVDGQFGPSGTFTLSLSCSP